MTAPRIRVVWPTRNRIAQRHFPRYLDALKWAQDEAPGAGPIRIESTATGKLLSERRADGRWYNANGDPLPTPRLDQIERAAKTND